MGKRKNDDNPYKNMKCVIHYGPGSEKYIDEWQRRRAEMMRPMLEKLSVAELKELEKILDEKMKAPKEKVKDSNMTYIYHDPERGI